MPAHWEPGMKNKRFLRTRYVVQVYTCDYCDRSILNAYHFGTASSVVRIYAGEKIRKNLGITELGAPR